MPWIVGIDEAGYGPNLGPFVMTSVACRVPEHHRGADLWAVLEDAACRPGEPSRSRMVVGDSKLVYTSGKGLAELERTVHAAVSAPVLTLADMVTLLGPQSHGPLQGEAWYTGDTALPVHADDHACQHTARTVAGLCAQLQIDWGRIHTVIVCPAGFNAIVDRWGSKGAVLTSSILQLLERRPMESDDLTIFVDKHGGRNHYAATLQPAFPDCLVLAREEGNDRSMYEVEDAGRQVQITFQPRADAEHFCVALASMVSKYLREVLMLEFNRFWQDRLPGLKPTAGYPPDAQRYWEVIRPLASKLGLAEDTLWRRK